MITFTVRFRSLVVSILFFVGFLDAGVKVEGNLQYYPTLQEALGAVEAGETLLLEPGTYRGNFVIERPLTLKSLDPSHPAVLDGEGRGTVLEIRSDNVQVENINIIHSGKSERFVPHEQWMDQWGDSGITVYAYRQISLSGLHISDCDDGITILGTQNFRIENCVVSRNHLSGILIEGSRKGLVEHNQLERNEGGITVSRLYKVKRLIMPKVGSPSYQQELKRSNDAIKTAIHSSHIRIIRNLIVGNGGFGIHLSYSEYNEIIHNKIAHTGKSRKPDYDRIKANYQWLLSMTGGSYDASIASHSLRMAGTGIEMTCDTHDNRIEKNLIIDNYSYGIIADLSHKNTILQYKHISRRGFRILNHFLFKFCSYLVK